MKENSIWLNGILGVVIGDALGVPVEFCSRTERDTDPVTDMRSYGTFHLPAGSWSDDSSLTLAALDSLKNGKLDLDDVMQRFVQWLYYGKYTPWGRTFDVGGSCMQSIENYANGMDIHHCGTKGANENGNGSLMRIIPFVLFLYKAQKEHGMSDEEAVLHIHEASALTHAHLRSCIACGLYYFIAREVIGTEGDLNRAIQKGLDNGFRFYDKHLENTRELSFYQRLRNLEEFRTVPRNKIHSSGYVVDSLEAAIWCLCTTSNYKECELKAVNLGQDTDSIAAIAGGLAGLYYTTNGIPDEWLDVIARRDWIQKMCESF